ncbi:MAG: CBS domain-containing protein, partial [Nitrososphaera sp.]
MQRQFVTLEESATVSTAVEQMQSQKLESVIVTREGRAVGIVTNSDVVEKVVLKGEDSRFVSIKSVMSFPVISMSSAGTVKQALQLMRVNRIKRVLVADNTGVIGIVTQRSLADAVSKSVLERTLERAKSTFRMRYKPVLGNLGVLLQFSAVLLVVPALVGTALGEAGSITGIYLEVVGLSFTGFFLMAYGEKGQMNLKQASIFIVASFIVMSLFGSLPYVYLNPFMPGIDANSLFVNSLFESASGFTTTGLSMITQPENLPQSFNFYRSYTQWVGGLSFVYLVMMLFFPEEKLSAWKSVLGGGMLKLKEFIVTLVGIFSVYTVVLVILLLLTGQIANLYAVGAVFSTIT